MRSPAKKRRKRKTAKVEKQAQASPSSVEPMGAEELPENPDSLLAQIQDPEQVDLALDQSMREQTITNRAEDGREPPSRYNRNNPTMKRI